MNPTKSSTPVADREKRQEKPTLRQLDEQELDRVSGGGAAGTNPLYQPAR
jgi:hypothetical protein